MQSLKCLIAKAFLPSEAKFLPPIASSARKISGYVTMVLTAFLTLRSVFLFSQEGRLVTSILYQPFPCGMTDPIFVPSSRYSNCFENIMSKQ